MDSQFLNPKRYLPTTRIVYPKTTLFLIAILSLFLDACTSMDNKTAADLNLDIRTTVGYHFLDENPLEYGLLHEGYIVGIEKTRKNLIGVNGIDISVPRIVGGKGFWFKVFGQFLNIPPRIRTEF